MFTINPFSELTGFISPFAMQVYVIAMVILVVGGTLLDTIHKKSAKYFFENAEKARAAASKSLSGGEKVSIAIKTVAEDVLLPVNSATRAAGSPIFSPCTVSSCLPPPRPS